MGEKHFDPESIAEKEKSDPVLISNLKEAINSGDKDRVMEALGALDKKLTRSVTGTFAEKPDASLEKVKGEVADFLEKIKNDSWGKKLLVYLGDGGYSRLLIDVNDDGDIYVGLTYNATDNVREAWDKLE